MTPRRGRETGMATAELAVAVPALVVVLALGLAAVRLGIDRVRVVDAAHLAARVVARGEPGSAARAAASAAAPTGSEVSVSVGGGTVRVVVTAPAPPVLGAIGLGAVARGEATARLEGAGPDGSP
ncbi:TadE family type IV pilus minor pilin [Phycicoccus flavus]|uniref:TadE family type IV pilus minor pilin n=1 Tax=Phycicoccus flavus TaxID=2502783 RepID=UPI000FEBD2D1|nr:TadE family type IV pilus minor pilin [Phycicoccus flavus]NHA68292.1 pilus assembly protein TadE [Phycicoccus flavus]